MNEQKAWWKSKTILGIVGLLGAFLFERFHLAVSSDDITNVITLAGGLLAAIVAIVGRVKAQKSLTMTMPGGAFNPRAEVRKAIAVKPSDKGHSLLAPLFLIAAFELLYLTALAGATWQASRYSETFFSAHNSPLISFHKAEDNRPFIIRLLCSLRIVPTFAVIHGTESNTASITKIELQGGAEF